MIGSLITRVLVMVFGYAYPAYECFKTVEMNKPDIEQLRFWCQYWILVAVLTVCERICDTFVSWVPMYSEAKLAFVIYLWYPKTKGTTYVYDSFFRPYVAKHETEIDRNLLELRTWAGDIAVLYWQRTASYGQARVFEILQYIASQSTPKPHPAKPQQGAKARRSTAAPNHKPAATTQPETEEPPSPSSSSSSSQQEEDAGPSKVPTETPPAAGVNEQKTTVMQPLIKTTKSFNSNEAEAMEIETVSSVNENANPPPQETIMEKLIKVGRLRKTRDVGTR